MAELSPNRSIHKERGIEVLRLERHSTGGSCDVSYWGSNWGRGRLVIKNIVIKEKPGQLPAAKLPSNLSIWVAKGDGEADTLRGMGLVGTANPSPDGESGLEGVRWVLYNIQLPSHLKAYVLGSVMRHYFTLVTRGGGDDSPVVHRRRRAW